MDFDKLINFKTNWKSYGIDVILLSALGWLILSFADALSKQNIFEIPAYIKNSPELIRITLFFALLVLFFALAKKMFNFVSTKIRANRTYKFSFDKWRKEWIFNGKSAPENTSDFRIEFSRAGCLLNTYFWKDLRMNFEAKHTHDVKSFGIIFRAEDLNSYFMIEVNESSVNPGVRFSSGWEEVENFNHSLELNDFFRVKLEVKDDTAWLYLQDSLVYSWILPNYVDVNHWEAGVNQNPKSGSAKTDEIEKRPLQEHVQQIHFKSRPGKIGFRAHSGQGAIIRGLTVEPL